MLTVEGNFLPPWCAVLRGRISYRPFVRPKESADLPKRDLFVRLPTRFNVKTDTDGGGAPSYYNDAAFYGHLEQIRDALALLAAVAQIDESGWKFLLEKKYGVKLGKSGQHVYEENCVKNKTKFPLTLETQIIRFCGVNQHTDPSPEYLKALEKVAAFDSKQKFKKIGNNVRIPVHLVFSTSIFKREDLVDGCLDPLK
ncbi:LOW QUALITY PROTEIN: hypothetical protein PHMEG_00023232 [Phytophthora megakarya]|uniref:Uncharacterized protein n=1 Tax=Phytophthora megakarya TaxID=4795 RepID=A0A225VGU9_9STRA|nr:LOW QUALITY PROTEIN: hypothetical protein PHMEG_00023232 [Phytophthora megakarya]